MVVQLNFSVTNQQVAEEFKIEAPDFRQEKGLQQIWQALQTITKLGVPVDALARWTTSTADFSVAQELRKTVRARYEQQDWSTPSPAHLRLLAPAQRTCSLRDAST